MKDEQEVQSKATPLEAGDPVEVPSVLGATFAERAAAAKKASVKAVSGKTAENKSVSRKSTK